MSGSIPFASVFKYLLSIKLPLAKLLQYTVGQTHKSFGGMLKLKTSSRISRCFLANAADRGRKRREPVQAEALQDPPRREGAREPFGDRSPRA